MQIVAICGYRRSGKDYLASQISRGEIEGWSVREVEDGAQEKLKTALGNSTPVYRESFAGPLKREVAAVLRMEVSRLEEIKEDPLPDSLLPSMRERYDLSSYDPPTYRSLLIEHGFQARVKNPNHWIETLFSSLERRLETGSSSITLITDLRFQNELQCLQKMCESDSRFSLLTIRVYRSCVPVPPLDVASEHDLDSSLTSLLLCPEDDIEKALTLFPQYWKTEK